MIKKITLVLLLLLLVLPSVQAQSDWFVFLYNGINKELLRINPQNGSQEIFSLGLGENDFVGGQEMSFSADGTRVAFCTSGPNGSTFFVRDLATQANTVQVPFGPVLGCRVTPQGLSADGTLVAVGIVNYFPGDPNADPNNPVWRLLLLDLNSGNIVYELNATSPEALAAEILPDSAILPEVRYFANNQVIFAEVPYGVGGAPEWRAFTWNLNDNSVALDPTNRWGKSGLSFLNTTGELVWLDHDPAQPFVDPNSPIPALNVVRLADKSGAERMIHSTGEWVLADTTFISGGERLALLYLAAFDQENPTAQVARWRALGRDGSLSEMSSGANFSQMADAPGGYVLFEMQVDESQTQFNFVLVYNGEIIWSANDMTWELAGTTPAPEASGLAAFS